MADISKCRGNDCPIRSTCYRFTAPDGHWQSYFRGESGLNIEEKRCSNYYAEDQQTYSRRRNLQMPLTE